MDHNYSSILAGQRGDGWGVGAASITADIVCQHHNGVGFKMMPLRGEKEVLSTAHTEEAC